MHGGWRWFCCGVLTLVVGCGSNSSGGTSGTPRGRTVASSLSGWAAQPSARAGTPTLSGTPPAAPLVGALVRLVDRRGATLAQTTTAADGRFGLVDVPFAGTTALELTPSGGAPTNFWVTMVHGRTVTAGQTFPVTRAAAAATLTGLAPAGALVALTQNPLPDDTEVHPTFGGPSCEQLADTAAHVTAGNEWLGLIDPTPGAPFSHAVRYVFIDATTGAVTTLDNQAWLPSVNFVPTWDYERDLLRYLGPLPSAHDLITTANALPPGAVVASPDVLTFPDPTPLTRSAHEPEPPRQGGNPNWFAVIWIGVPEVWFMVDESRINSWFQSLGVPANHIWAKTGVLYNSDDPMILPLRAETSLLPGASLPQRGREAADGFKRAEEAVLQVRKAGGFPTLYVWAESHGDHTGRVRDFDLGEGIGSAAYNFALKIGSFFSSELKKVAPADVTALPLRYIEDVLPLHESSACDIRAWVATCYSYNHLQRWRANLLKTSHDVVLYSSSGDVPSYGNGFLSQFGNYFSGSETHFSELGVNFTRQVTANTPPAFTAVASPPASDGPQTWVRRSECQPWPTGSR